MPELPRKIRTVLDLLVTELELTVAVALAYVGAMVLWLMGSSLFKTVFMIIRYWFPVWYFCPMVFGSLRPF